MGATCANTWDEVWAEFDAREAARARLANPAAMAPPPAPRAPPRPRRPWRFRRALAVMACIAGAAYAGAPVASAVQMAAAIQRGDAAALAPHVEWNTLRPAVEAALAAEMQRNAAAPMPDFITGMAREMTERLASPAGLAALLHERLATGGVPSAREMSSRVRMLEAGLWEVTLASVHRPDRSASLTLALTDPMRLRWEVQAIQLPGPPPARFR